MVICITEVAIAHDHQVTFPWREAGTTKSKDYVPIFVDCATIDMSTRRGAQKLKDQLGGNLNLTMDCFNGIVVHGKIVSQWTTEYNECMPRGTCLKESGILTMSFTGLYYA